MARLLRLVGPGQDPPAARRKGRHAASLSLNEAEARAVRVAARNIARTFGGIGKLAAALGVDPITITRKRAPSPGLAVALARLSGMSVDAVLGWKALAALPGGAP